MSRALGSRCPSRWAGGVESSLSVVGHLSVDDVGELTLEDAHGFFLGVTASAGVVVDAAGAWIAAELGDSDSVQAGIDTSVAAAVETVADRFVVAFGRGGGQWGGAVESGEAALTREAAGVADFHEQFRFDPITDPAELLQCRPGLLSELAQLGRRVAIGAVELEDGDGVSLQQLQPQRRRPVLTGERLCSNECP